ncbi:MAG: LLM class flavin-dependent oxidoreductase [Actinobacteria bacterium]|nr:LLM class flavin-dependent oxidoreductase [Actinomycetota bacterium]NIS31758.1 LLM class flavin-dependent oxidoreductase [Actinomycetota bacterium]NIT95868.1 LLM class flavin-dependent oxidoreductase [Actinomycetota bacterium]NIU19544.1 LLM class flavin-dependent oxidoreductase [Actinomycetota bacterium]NIU66855.1 LLM class flavin-dependent oxidoreductase [Actinomycetota bacterium]
MNPPAPIALGIQIVPVMGSAEVVDTIRAAEELGYRHCMVADEGLMQDVYVCLGAAAEVTDRIRLGVVTNGYTRHPAATAAALATVDELSGGRAFVTLVAGGTMVLHPMGIERAAPFTVLDETIDIFRALWTGEPVSFEGTRFRLDGAQLSLGAHDIPIWVAARGERILDLAGRKADGVVLMVKSDIGQALEVVDGPGRDVTRVYLDRLAFTAEMLEEAKGLYGYAILDSPPRMLRSLGIDDDAIASMRAAFAEGGPAAVAPLVTDEMVGAYQIVGTVEECRVQLAEMIRNHRLDAFCLNIIAPGLEANRRLMAEVAEIVRGVTP